MGRNRPGRHRHAYVNPPVALLVGWWLGHESFSSNTLLGLPIVLGAVALHAWVQSRSSSEDYDEQERMRSADPG